MYILNTSSSIQLNLAISGIWRKKEEIKNKVQLVINIYFEEKNQQ